MQPSLLANQSSADQQGGLRLVANFHTVPGASPQRDSTARMQWCQCRHTDCARTGVHRTVPRHIFTSMPLIVSPYPILSHSSNARPQHITQEYDSGRMCRNNITDFAPAISLAKKNCTESCVTVYRRWDRLFIVVQQLLYNTPDSRRQMLH